MPFELLSLSQATHYQRWVFLSIAADIGARVLEVGAGIGNMSRWFPRCEKLILTDTDDAMLDVLRASIGVDDHHISVRKFDVLENDPTPFFHENLDTIVSFNVLEHLADDRFAMERLCTILRRSAASGTKRHIVFVPAHPWAYGVMDKAYGHFRRYSRRSLMDLCSSVAPDASVRIRYLNAFGLLGWVLKGRVLKTPSLSMNSIRAFEMLCPILCPLDDLLHRTFHLPFGQSLLAVMTFGKQGGKDDGRSV
jgi:SAM-dependent methyltransferase